MNKIFEKWKFIGDAYNGIGGFDDGNQIEKYSRESNDKLTARKNIAYYANVFESKVDRFVGYLYKTDPTRMLQKNLLLTQFIDNADGSGSSLDVVMMNFAKQAKARGVGVMLIDNVRELPTSLSEQTDSRAFPYLVPIMPENIVKYKLDKYKKFEFVAYKDYIDESTFKDEKITEVIRYFDKTNWAIYAEDKLLDEGVHNLGLCPIIYFSEKGNFESLGEFSKLAWLSKRHYNLHSEQDEQLRSNTFSILSINGSRNANLDLSSDNALFYSGDKAPSFIAPPAEPLQAYDVKIASLENLMDKIAFDVTTSNSQESGISLELKFQTLNSSLSAFAKRLEDFERKILDIFCLYLNIDNTSIISYQKNFNIIDTQHEVETLSMINDIADLPKYKALKLTQIIKNDLNNIDEDDLAIILAEIEDIAKEVKHTDDEK